MNHFMLPESRDGIWSGMAASTKYGNFAMDALLRKILQAGGREQNLEIKIFGGADVCSRASSVGRSNVELILEYLAEQNLAPHVVDVGGPAGRKIIYDPISGRVMRRLIRLDQDSFFDGTT